MSANSSTKTANLDQYLTDLVRQGYLEREEIGDPKKGAKKGGGVKRVRSNKDDDSGTQYQWRWGSRAFSEVSEQDLATFIAEIMVGDTQGQEAEDDDDDSFGESSTTEAEASSSLAMTSRRQRSVDPGTSRRRADSHTLASRRRSMGAASGRMMNSSRGRH